MFVFGTRNVNSFIRQTEATGNLWACFAGFLEQKVFVELNSCSLLWRCLLAGQYWTPNIRSECERLLEL